MLDISYDVLENKFQLKTKPQKLINGSDTSKQQLQLKTELVRNNHI